ncbi:CDP-diacylglycerol--glycerol-3-phosphate 3-phosphatidyltransferase [Fusibacter ferrireducens]|uniref:CDP-diacylglycerol--glycerol-3-phosphate 3-phosphatidyltransferase n=1 Tax=Fusibacter ferrireducens TaxID=2785058 RepID=A0ABR9ZR53_9FIRM|nr:CDP-diacylglycerol--glycerol-3-phosphate 3-phosphatidyltransferase [Fusibacter ferrireducens]MBF4692935.1 CDP-diacylglycerol--glycerol-3-phosphate 3-phosphatidyltransferase [Fusibacter ferrireducens]
MRHVPNLLTVFRILLVPIFIFTYLQDHNAIALTVFIIAGLTDLLDGYIARKYHLITTIGTLLDPLADKLMLLSVLTCMAMKNVLPIWVPALMYLKEFSLVIGSTILYFRHEKKAIPSNIYGKIATVSFSSFILLLLWFPQQPFLRYGIYFSMLLKIIAIISYILIYKNTAKIKI